MTVCDEDRDRRLRLGDDVLDDLERLPELHLLDSIRPMLLAFPVAFVAFAY
jgi:hypothetical protein